MSPVVTSMDPECAAILAKQPVLPGWEPYVAFDIETSGELPEYALQPWRYGQGKAWITTMAFSFRDPADPDRIIHRGKIRPTVEDLRAFFALVAAMKGRIVTWNGTFDMAWCIAYGLEAEVRAALWLDGMRLWKHLDITASFATEDHGYSLKGDRGAVMEFAPEMAGYEEDVDYHDPSIESLRKLLKYNKDDTDLTLIAVEEIFYRLDPRRRNVALIEADSYAMIAAANLEGMRINRKATVALSLKLTTTSEKMRLALAEDGITDTVIRSPKQLSAKLFDEFGLPDISGKKSTAKDFLTQMVVMDDRVDLMMRFRESLNLNSKFIGAIVKSCEYNGDRVTRPQAIVFGTYTSRLTYNSKQGKGVNERYIGFALHQMKRDPAFRALVQAPVPDEVAPEGYDIVEFDAAGQEFRWMAIVSEDPVMLKLCLPGEDPHAYMAGEIYGEPYRVVQVQAKVKGTPSAKQRQGGKVANLALQYRTSAKTLQVRARTDHGLVLSEKEAYRIHATYARTYKNVPMYWQRQIALGRELGYACTLAGRRVQIKGNWRGPQAWSMESTMINYPVQGTGGEQKYLAMSVLKDRLAEFGARFAWDLHDGIYFYVPKSKSMKFIETMKPVLDNLPYRKAWGIDVPIPMPFDAKVGPSWGELKEVEL